MVFDSIVCSYQAKERFIKALDKLQDFVSKAYKNTLKKRSTEFYFKTQ